jgi:hypothetical protein
MNAKEKAWQMFNYYGSLNSRYDKAAECAIYAAEMLLDFMKKDDQESDTVHWANHKESKYWEKVIDELHNLKPQS